MKIKAVLEDILKVEEGLEDLYRTFAERFEDDEELSELFRQLSYEEKSHADLVRFQLDLGRHKPERFDGIDVNWAGVQGTLGEIEKARETAHRVDDALTSALIFETSNAEQQMAEVVALCSPGVTDMLDRLSRESGDHFARLQRLAEKRKALVWIDDEEEARP